MSTLQDAQLINDLLMSDPKLLFSDFTENDFIEWIRNSTEPITLKSLKESSKMFLENDLLIGHFVCQNWIASLEDI